MDRNEELLARFEREYMEVNSISHDRRGEQFSLLRRFAADLDHPLDQMTPQEITVFIGEGLKRGLHPNTARKHLGMIRSFITWGSSAGLIEDLRTYQLKSVGNPRGSSSRSTPKPYKAHEIHQLYALLAEKYPALPERGRGTHALRNFLHGQAPRMYRHLWRHARRLQFEAQIALALEQGLRLIEIGSLSIAALHPDNDEIVVLTAKQGPGEQVKRAIPYATHARAVMQEWLDFRYLLRPPHDEPWLQLCRVGPIEDQVAPQTAVSRKYALTKLLGEHWRWHRLRHTACTEWLRAGVPLEKVRVFMGHARLEQTLAYVELLSSDISQAFGRAEADFAKRLGLAA